MSKVSATAFVVLAASAGCLTGLNTVPTAFDAEGFHHPQLDYHVDVSSAGELVAPRWIVDNYQRDAAGALSVSKVGPGYERTLWRDANGDGRPDNLGRTPIYDLLVVHERDAGVIWIRTFPLPRDMERVELRVLLRMYVDRISGTGVRITEIQPGTVEAVARRFATRDLQGSPAIIGGREAFIGTFDVASLEQLEADPDRSWERVQLILVRPELLWHGYSEVSGTQFFPTVMALGYSNQPDEFERSLPAFHSFVSRVRFESEMSRAIRERALACAPDRPFVRVSLSDRTGEVFSPDASAACIAPLRDDVAIQPTSVWRSLVVFREPVRLSSPAPVPPAPPTSTDQEAQQGDVLDAI